ncbi:hypothetical protein BDZ97DRAFT_1919814 [Flammula alnicola]|nr:hypothetical protein BDZ97DRAFT_1919814 [Flammula alnicola]
MQSKDTQKVAQLVTQATIYNHPSIVKLAGFLSGVVADSDNFVLTSSRTDAIEPMITKYTTGLSQPIASKSSSTRCVGDDAVVLLTGSTSNLGAQLLESLLHGARVTMVYVLNRPSSGSKSVEERQAERFADKGLDVSLLSTERLVFLEEEASHRNLGFRDVVYDEQRDGHNPQCMETGLQPLPLFRRVIDSRAMSSPNSKLSPTHSSQRSEALRPPERNLPRPYLVKNLTKGGSAFRVRASGQHFLPTLTHTHTSLPSVLPFMSPPSQEPPFIRLSLSLIQNGTSESPHFSTRFYRRFGTAVSEIRVLHIPRPRRVCLCLKFLLPVPSTFPRFSTSTIPTATTPTTTANTVMQDPKVVTILELNVELLKVCMLFQAKGVPNSDPRFQQYSKCLQSNLTRLAAAADQSRQGKQSNMHFPIMDAPPSVGDSSIAERIRQIYGDLPSIFAKDIAWRQQMGLMAPSSNPASASSDPSTPGTPEIPVDGMNKRRETGEGKGPLGSSAPAGMMPPPSSIPLSSQASSSSTPSGPIDPRARLSRITERTEESRPTSTAFSTTNVTRPANPTPDTLRRSALLGGGTPSHSRSSTDPSSDRTLPPPGRLTLVTRSPTGSIRTILSINSSSSNSSNGSRSTVFAPPLSSLPDISDFISTTSGLSRQSSLVSSHHSRTVDDTVIQNQEYVYPGDSRVITPNRGHSLRRTGSMTDLDEEFKSAINRARGAGGLFGGSPVTISSGSSLGKNIFVTPPPSVGRGSDRARSELSDEIFFSAGSSDGLRSNVSSTYFSQMLLTSTGGLRTMTGLTSITGCTVHDLSFE